jgi:ethanolamine utilization protein EutN
VFLARVVGTVVATRKDPKLDGSKLLIVVPVEPDGTTGKGYRVAVDTVNAGIRDTVLCVGGSSARMAEGLAERPVDTAIVGVVDHADLDESG